MDFKLDNVIQVLFSSDNIRRAQAQRFVDQIPVNNFDQGIQAFLITMNHENPQVASMAALLLKKKYLQPKQMAEKLSNNRLEYIIKSVQGCMTPDKPVMFLKRCCDIMVKVYNQANQQKQLISLIQAMSNSETHNMKMALYYMIQIICECSFDDKLLMQHSGSLQVIFQKGLMDENNQIKVAAFKTLTIFLSSIQDEKMVKKFEAVLQVLISKAIELIKFDQESGVTALESLNQLIESHPSFIKPIIPQLLSIFTQIMETSALLINLRTTAMFGVLTICVNHPAVVRKSEYFKTNMVPAYMRMLSQINGMSIEQWSEQLNDEIISKNDISLSTEEHIQQILPQLKNKFMLPLFIPYIQQYLSSGQIEHQHAGLVAMAILTEDCHESFKGSLKNIIELIIPMMKTNNPRIMHDILMALGYMSEEFAPELQVNYGNIMLEFIIACLQYPALKVQYKAVQCLQNFEKGLMEHREVKVMEKYLPQIMQEIARIFQYSVMKMNYILMQDVLDTITNIAEMNPFENYYKVFMPGMKKILNMIGSQNQQQIYIKGKTVETIGYLLASVKTHPELFEADCKQIMQTMMNLSLTLDFDDSMHKATFVVYENVATSLKHNFAAYAETIYPLIIQSANRKVEFNIIEQGDVSKTEALKKKKNSYAAYKLDLKIDGVKSLVLNTDHLAQKIEATNLIVQMAQDMGHAFAPFIEKTIPTIKQLISYKHNKEIRSNMIQTIKYMIADCTTNEQKSYVVAQTFQPLSGELAQVIKQKNASDMSSIIEAMSQMMPFMTQQMATRMPSMMTAALALVKSQTKQIEKEYADKDMDQALQEQMGNQIQEAEESLEYIEKIIKMATGMPAFEQLRTLFPSDYQFE